MKQEEIPLQPHLLSTIKIFSNPRIPGTCSRINPTALPQDHHHRAPPLLENPNDATQIQNHTSKLPQSLKGPLQPKPNKSLFSSKSTPFNPSQQKPPFTTVGHKKRKRNENRINEEKISQKEAYLILTSRSMIIIVFKRITPDTSPLRGPCFQNHVK
ncbi:hypothetical protein AAC387_Pa05g3789 [Persea americana]